MHDTVTRERVTQPSALPNAENRKRLRSWRGFKDHFSRIFVGIGGVSVIIALGLIFVYLAYEAVPMMRPASVEVAASYDAPGNGEAGTLAVFLERHQQLAVRFADDGGVTFFRPESGEIVLDERLPIPEGVEITSFARAEPRTGLVALGLSDGTAILARHEYEDTWVGGRTVAKPSLSYPFEEEPFVVDDDGLALDRIGVQEGGGGVKMAVQTADGGLRLAEYAGRTNFMTGEVEYERTAVDLEAPPYDVRRLMLSIDMRDLLVGDEGGNIHYYDIGNINNVQLRDSASVIRDGGEVSTMDYLLGTVSLIVGGEDGSVSQWFLVRGDDNIRRLQKVREFEPHSGAVTSLNPEYARKGFFTGDENGNLGIRFSTSERTLYLNNVVEGAGIVYAMPAPRGNGGLLLDTDNRIHYLDIWNRHPEVSLRGLWGQIWYEGRSEPTYTWQSSSATDEFEPKFSLVPLTLGTIKAAFYAMLFATPLAIMGAIYSAYFMTRRMRSLVKPSIEIMEALPTVILGFLAGLWMAPFVENHLPAVFSILVLLPLSMLLVAYLWHLIPHRLRSGVPDGWEAAILIPVVLFVGYACIQMSPVMEVAFFSGDMRQWLTDQGYTYDQRNALVVGFAMGFAVIPTIFSIAEDAVFNVPKHLTQGSLALGATRWQTMTRVVLLTASPGIFSGVMIGMGRAIGETMIVVMATGNSPVVNMNIFEGMRTLSANIAVEMPEAAVGGSHFRILFLSALVLFVMTFFFNTIAEIVRQRLRKKYASL